MGRYVDGLCRRVERGGREERSGQCLRHWGSVVESARFQKAGPFYAFSEKGFSGQTAVTPKRANGRRVPFPLAVALICCRPSTRVFARQRSQVVRNNA